MKTIHKLLPLAVAAGLTSTPNKITAQNELTDGQKYGSVIDVDSATYEQMKNLSKDQAFLPFKKASETYWRTQDPKISNNMTIAAKEKVFAKILYDNMTKDAEISPEYISNLSMSKDGENTALTMRVMQAYKKIFNTENARFKKNLTIPQLLLIWNFYDYNKVSCSTCPTDLEPGTRNEELAPPEIVENNSRKVKLGIGANYAFDTDENQIGGKVSLSVPIGKKWGIDLSGYLMDVAMTDVRKELLDSYLSNLGRLHELYGFKGKSGSDVPYFGIGGSRQLSKKAALVGRVLAGNKSSNPIDEEVHIVSEDQNGDGNYIPVGQGLNPLDNIDPKENSEFGVLGGELELIMGLSESMSLGLNGMYLTNNKSAVGATLYFNL